ncbi:hypothetical protein [Clostridium nigeriense]|uniref:hypothetical protein n=1 Tax=Clostridium nigeriense TaxID=1805470 RepID=UPI00083303F5|nr:hypothetical protein [Clostridium nigeriense]
MENNINLLSLNYIANMILNNTDDNLLITNIDDNSVLEIINEIASYYLIDKEQLMIFSDLLKFNLLNEELFKNLNIRLIDLQSSYNIKDRINKLLLDLDDKTGKTIISKVKLINRGILKRLDNLMKINSLFCKCKTDELSLLQKYIETESIKNYDISFDKSYKRFRIKKPLNNYIYDDLRNACNSILSSDTSLYYIKYRRFIDNDIFNCIKKPFNYDKLRDGINKLEEIILNDIDKYKLIHSKYTEDFFDEITNKNDINEEHIMTLANIINFKYNYILLNKNKKKRWFNFFCKYENLDEEHNLTLYSINQKEIYEEYIHNFNIIRDLKDKLLFLKEIIKEENYNEIINSIIREDNIKEYLSFNKKILNTAYNTEEIFKLIGELSNIEMDILDYCYNDLETKSDINLLISLIPTFKLYLEIEEEEAKYSDILNIYKNYDDIISSICDDITKRNSLILNSINNIWDNQLREGAPILKENINNIGDEALKKFFPCVISSYTGENIKKLINENFFFKRTIFIINNPNDLLHLEDLNKISEKIIILSTLDNDLIGFKKINLLNLSRRDKISTDYNLIYKDIEGYLINKFPSEKIYVNDDHIEMISRNQKIFIRISPVTIYEDNYEVIQDIFLYNNYKSNNIRFYRIWYRDWWIDKFKELNKLENFIKE